KGVGQRFMAAAFNAPVSVMEESAGEGGAWGIALLAAFMRKGGGSLEQFLSEHVFAGTAGLTIEPDPKDVESFRLFMERYPELLRIEGAAVEHFDKKRR
ncbi:MAG: ATPase, partial [Treponema sp.]|nr:ATPase [Treponema sp.]